MLVFVEKLRYLFSHPIIIVIFPVWETNRKIDLVWDASNVCADNRYVNVSFIRLKRTWKPLGILFSILMARPRSNGTKLKRAEFFDEIMRLKNSSLLTFGSFDLSNSSVDATVMRPIEITRSSIPTRMCILTIEMELFYFEKLQFFSRLKTLFPRVRSFLKSFLLFFRAFCRRIPP